MISNALDVRVYPIAEPQGNTLAFASISIDDLAAIRGIRVVDSKKGMFVTMPQSKDNEGNYRDIAFPLNGDLRKEIGNTILAEYKKQSSLSPDQRGYAKPDKDMSSDKNADDVKLDVKVYPIAEPKGDTLAFAGIGLDGVVAIRGIRIINSDKGMFVSMPQSKGKDNQYYDVAFPLSGDLRKAISSAVLDGFKQQAAEHKQGIGERLAEGKAQAAQNAANAPARSAAKKAPGLGE